MPEELQNSCYYALSIHMNLAREQSLYMKSAPSGNQALDYFQKICQFSLKVLISCVEPLSQANELAVINDMTLSNLD